MVVSGYRDFSVWQKLMRKTAGKVSIRGDDLVMVSLVIQPMVPCLVFMVKAVGSAILGKYAYARSQ